MSRPSIAGFLRDNEDEGLIQRVMSSEKVSIQVARNLLKAGKLGVGPGAKYVNGLPPAQGDAVADARGAASAAPPPRFDKKAAAQAMAMKLKKLQEEQEDAEDENIALLKKQQMAKKRIGIVRLGPVSARQEEVDPLKIKIAAMEAKREESLREAPVRQLTKPEDMQINQEAMAAIREIKAVVPQEELRKINKEQRQKRNNKNHKDEDSDDSEDNRARGNKRQRQPSPDDDRPVAASSSGSGSNLMSEKEAMAALKKGKKADVVRGSASAAQRIQREMAEWEGAKAKNPEFWKPPKFCLVLGSGRR